MSIKPNAMHSEAARLASRYANKINPAPLIEQIEGMGRVDCRQFGKGKAITKKSNSDIRIALVRPLGSLQGNEEKEAVKEMGEPYQLELLAAALMKENYNVRIFDQLAGPFNPSMPSSYPEIKPDSAFADEICSFHPDAVGITSFSYNFRKAIFLGAQIKERLGIPIILGGYHATSVGKQHLVFKNHSPDIAEVFRADLRNVFQHGIIDYACIGEGIRTISDILSILKCQKNPSDVEGIAYLENNNLRASESRRLSLDEYPFAFRPNDFNPMMYYATGRDYPFLLMTSQNGCRHSCSFCSTALNYPGAVFRNTENFIDELKSIRGGMAPLWPRQRIMVNLTDEDFGADPCIAIGRCKAISASGLHEHFEFNSFLDNNTINGKNGHELLEAMRAANFVFSFIGIESLLEDAAAGYRRYDAGRRDKIDWIQRAILRMENHGLLYFGDHIAGYPAHTLEDIKEDYSRLFQLRRMHYVYMPILAPMPGTPLYWRIILGELGAGFLPHATYDLLDANHQVVPIRGGGDVKAVRDEYVQKFYERPEYAQDADAAIRENPGMHGFFSKMLRKISGDYPSNDKLRHLADKYLWMSNPGPCNGD
jgi:radical SAM superfamily enzyme YgiQ (UPF0313 family)